MHKSTASHIRDSWSERNLIPSLYYRREKRRHCEHCWLVLWLDKPTCPAFRIHGTETRSTRTPIVSSLISSNVDLNSSSVLHLQRHNSDVAASWLQEAHIIHAYVLPLSYHWIIEVFRPQPHPYLSMKGTLGHPWPQLPNPVRYSAVKKYWLSLFSSINNT